MSSNSFKSRLANWLLSDIEVKSSPVSGVTNPETWLVDLLSAGPAQSGISVNPTTAMQCTPVYRAVTLISESVGLPAKLYRRLEKGGKEPDTAHPAYTLAHSDPNEWQSAAQFREQVTTDAILHGHGFALVQRDTEDRPLELLRLPPGTVTAKTDDFGEPYYLVGTDQRRYGFRDIIHISAPGGIAPISAAKEAIGLALVLERHAARLFGHGARPSGVLSIKPRGNEETDKSVLANVHAAWSAAHGNGQSGKTAFLPADAEYTQLTLNSVDAQFAEMRTFQVLEIARAFRVPPHMLYELDRATWSNIADMGREFLTYSLRYWLDAWESAYRCTLLTPEERSGWFFEFVTDDIQRADYATRIDGYAKQIAARIRSPNEIRALENLPPYEGGDEFVNPNTLTSGAPPASPQETPDA